MKKKPKNGLNNIYNPCFFMKAPEIKTILDYKKLFESLPALFLILKPDSPHFTILDASNLYLAATMTKRNEIVNKGLFEVFPDNPNDLTATGEHNLKRSLQNVIEKKQQDIMPVQKYDIPLPAEKGNGFEERYWNPKNTPVLNDKNEIIYIVHKVEDVTASIFLEKKGIEENRISEEKSQFIRSNEERINLILQALLKYTTMDFSDRLSITDKGDELDAIAVGLNSVIDELENQMSLLKSTNSELEHTNKELDSFSYSVSHDLRAPLRAIGGYSQVLLEDYGTKLDDEGKHTVNVIIKNTFKMGALIDDLLTFSRVGKQNLTKVLLDMDNKVNTICRELSEQNKNGQLKINVKPLGSVEGDSSMVKLVIHNLISNAIKYSSRKEKAIIEIGSYNENNMKVFYVKDNGAGFDMKYYNKLFGVFQRLHSSNEFEGIGVGLALVHRIIKKHQGDVWAEAVLDKGATFYFSLPLTKDKN
ncbi:MAG: ATP-binding protein [Bacteroidia bacterium]